MGSIFDEKIILNKSTLESIHFYEKYRKRANKFLRLLLSCGKSPNKGWKFFSQPNPVFS
jgi:hypothetical protein